MNDAWADVKYLDMRPEAGPTCVLRIASARGRVLRPGSAGVLGCMGGGFEHHRRRRLMVRVARDILLIGEARSDPPMTDD